MAHRMTHNNGGRDTNGLARKRGAPAGNGPLAKLSRLRRRGSTLVEASIALPALIAVTVGGIEFGTLLHLRQSMMHAARESVRVLAVESGSASEARTVADGLLPDNDLPFVIDLTAPAPEGAGSRDAVATIAVPMRDVSLADFFGLFDEDDELRVTVTMRGEN